MCPGTDQTLHQSWRDEERGRWQRFQLSRGWTWSMIKYGQSLNMAVNVTCRQICHAHTRPEHPSRPGTPDLMRPVLRSTGLSGNGEPKTNGSYFINSSSIGKGEVDDNNAHRRNGLENTQHIHFSPSTMETCQVKPRQQTQLG